MYLNCLEFLVPKIIYVVSTFLAGEASAVGSETYDLYFGGEAVNSVCDTVKIH